MSSRRVLAAAFVAACAAVASATTLKRLTFTQVVAGSREVVVGTVRAQRPVAAEGAERDTNRIYTRVEFERLDVWHGAVRSATVTYAFAGGELDGRRQRVPGMPAFRDGARYVLCANPDDDTVCPTVGWGQGVYELRRDATDGVERVHDATGHAVYGFDAGLPVLRPTRERPRALTADELQVEVVRAVEAARRAAEERAAAERAAEEARAQEAQQPGGSGDAKSGDGGEVR